MSEQAQPEPNFWTCDDAAEQLSCTEMEEAVEEFLDKFFEPREPASAGLARMPESVTVYGYSRMTLDTSEPSLDPDMILERIVEDLDGNGYGDPDGNMDPFTKEGMADVMEKGRAFVAAIREHYQPWACEQTHKVDVDVKAWIAENRPDWLKGE